MTNQPERKNAGGELPSISLGVWAVVTICVALIIMAAINAALGPSPAQQAQRAAQTAAAQAVRDHRFNLTLGAAITLHERMRNPDSLKISKAIFMPDDTICFEYRAQNGFGGMENSTAILYAGILLSGHDSATRQLWKANCPGHQGIDMAEDANYGFDHYKKLHNN
jgi:hypothetical protein